MSPSATSELAVIEPWVHATSKDVTQLEDDKSIISNSTDNGLRKSTHLLDRNLHKEYPVTVGGKGNYLFTSTGRAIFDAAGGAAVSCLGHGNERVTEAIYSQLKTGIPYIASGFWGNPVVDELCKELIKGTDGKLSRVYLCSSGSEAMEATIKMSRQFFYEKNKKTTRVNFITREGSYHGNTIGALSLSGFPARKAPYIPLLMKNVHHISACNSYRQRFDGESDESFVARKAAELEEKFKELGPETVIGFIAEPVVGAALGCVPAVRGYLQSMRDICHKYGALFILDEVMCGMGRTGTLHAWQQDVVVPDIQTIGKGLGGGYQPIGAVLISEKVVQALMKGTGQFVHGQTYQGMPVQAAAALEVQKILREDNILENVTKQGAYLGERLKKMLGDHPHIGDIRGRGLFWGIEFVKDKVTKEPFPPHLQVAQQVNNMAMAHPYNMTTYPGAGTSDGISGDHTLLAPSYTVTKEDVNYIVEVLTQVVNKVFANLGDV